MLARVATTVVIVVLCLVSIGFTAYAYFSAALTYVSNTITAANFDVEVSVVSEGEEVAVFRDGRFFLADLEAGKAYTVTLTHIGSAQTGFVILSAVDCDDTYYTTQLSRGGELTFTVEVNAPTTVSFLAHWGTSSYYDKYKESGNTFFIQEEGSVSLSVNVDEEITDEEPGEQLPSVSAPENVAPSKPESQKPSEPAEGSAQEPPKEPAETPAEPVEPEPTDEPADSTEEPTEAPAEPVDPVDPEESADPAEPGESTEPETPGEETGEPSDPAEGMPENPEEPTGEPADEPVDAPAEEPTAESVGEPGE